MRLELYQVDGTTILIILEAPTVSEQNIWSCVLDAIPRRIPKSVISQPRRSPWAASAPSSAAPVPPG